MTFNRKKTKQMKYSMDYTSKLYTIDINGKLGETTIKEYLLEWRNDGVTSPRGNTNSLDWEETEDGEFWTVTSDNWSHRKKQLQFDTKEEAETAVLDWLYDRWTRGSWDNDAPMTFDTEEERTDWIKDNREETEQDD